MESRSEHGRCQEFPRAEVLSRKCGKSIGRDVARNVCLAIIGNAASKTLQATYTRRRNAVCASPLASALFSRGTCEMENFKARASLRQVQCKE